jgi:hypothetical protein
VAQAALAAVQSAPELDQGSAHSGRLSSR